MKIKLKRIVVIVPAMMLIWLTGCYAQRTYPYGYGYDGSYDGGYQNYPYGSSYGDRYGNQGYYGNDYDGRRRHRHDDDDDDDYRKRRYDQYPGYPYGGYYGR